MNPAVRDIVAQAILTPESLKEVGGLLPVDDEELNGWIDESLVELNQWIFLNLTIASVCRGRKVSTRHIRDGLTMIPDAWLVGRIFSRMAGEDLPEQVMAAFERSVVRDDLWAAAAHFACHWCVKHRAGVIPRELVMAAREQAKERATAGEPLAILTLIAKVSQDHRITDILAKRFPRVESENATKLGETITTLLEEAWEMPIKEELFVFSHRVRGTGTMRRAVPNYGRNDPCHCGSGKKHKRCCIEKDKERLRKSSDVAGKTPYELSLAPEEHFSLKRAMSLKHHDYYKLDPLNLSADELVVYLQVLTFQRMYQPLIDAFRKLELTQPVLEALSRAIMRASFENRKEVVVQLVEIAGDEMPAEDETNELVRLIQVRDEPEKLLNLTEELALLSLKKIAGNHPHNLAIGLMWSARPALGILFGQSLIPNVTGKNRSNLLEALEHACEKLDLPFEEEIGSEVDRVLKEEAAELKKQKMALGVAKQKLEEKAGEVRTMKHHLDQVRKEIRHREKVESHVHQSVPASKAPVVDESTLKELRHKVQDLKSKLKERYAERTFLRRELDVTHHDLEVLRTEIHYEDSVIVPDEPGIGKGQETNGFEKMQPVRLIEFPKKFHETLAHFPRAVASGAMTMIGRLAAAEATAFAGIVHLKVSNETLRVRVGIHHRLLFRLHPAHVEVVDLIARRDLEKWIRAV